MSQFIHLPFDEEYNIPFVRNFDYTSITYEKCQEIHSNGYCIIDNFLNDAHTSALLQELKWLSKQNNIMKSNKTQFNETKTLGITKNIQYAKPGIYEVDLHDLETRKLIPEMNALFHDSKNGLITAIQENLDDKLIRLRYGDNNRTVKLQYNSGNGGCFPFHYDNPGFPNNRQLTCILYFNKVK